MDRTILVVGTMDTKGEELRFVADQIRLLGCSPRIVDVSTQGDSLGGDVSPQSIAETHPQGAAAVLNQPDRGRAINAMAEALKHWMLRETNSDRIAGVVAIGGSGGTALVSPALQDLPIGMPKLIVSTMASGNTQPYVGCCDITLVYSVVDVAGLNSISRRVLSNAAGAITGMANNAAVEGTKRPAVGMTMFGVTTICVDRVRMALEQSGFDALVFHATGTGGRTMEKLVADGMIEGVLDITTTEVADEVVGGVLPAGPDRFDVILARGIPYVMSVGALDMVNFGAHETVPERLSGRLFHIHNPQVTLMRTTAQENQAFARWIARKINRSTAPLEVLIPEKGVSALDAEGQPFFDPKADEALFQTLESEVRQTDDRRVTRHRCHINDAEFSTALLDAFQRVRMTGSKQR